MIRNSIENRVPETEQKRSAVNRGELEVNSAELPRNCRERTRQGYDSLEWRWIG